MNRTHWIRVAALAGGFGLLPLTLAHAQVQGDANSGVIYACYIPASGTVYRIKGLGLPNACRGAHIEFSFNLTGVKGDIGPQGPAGTNGTNGEAGAPGAPGAPGTNGEAGAPGAPGAPGTNGTNGLDGTNGVDGKDGVSGYEIVRTTIPVGPGPFIGLQARCPSGKHPFGGGHEAPLASGYATRSSPDGLGTGWVIDWYNTGFSPYTVTVYAVCANAT